MQPDSLYSTVLHNYSYDDLKELCFTPDSTFPLVFDCDWGVWRDKAQADFGVSGEFFDLIRTLSGTQRYLQIEAYVKLSPLSLLVEHDLGYPCHVEGVYEAYAGYEEARDRRDAQMMVWFAQRVTPQEQEVVGPVYERAKEMASSWIGGLLKNLYYPPPNRKYDIHYLSLVLSHGRVDILDKIIHKYFDLPKDFKLANLEKGGLQGPFPLYDLPIQNTSQEDFMEILDSALSSADVRIVDFVRSIFRDRDVQGWVGRSNLGKSLPIHGRPEETYKIALRFIDQNTRAQNLDFMVELVLSQPRFKTSYSDLLYRNLGNIPFIQALLPYTDKSEVKYIPYDLEESSKFIYPVSVLLMEEYAPLN